MSHARYLIIDGSRGKYKVWKEKEGERVVLECCMSNKYIGAINKGQDNKIKFKLNKDGDVVDRKNKLMKW